MAVDYEQVLVESRQQWRKWLELNHRTSPGIWLVTWKSKSGKPRVPYDDIVEEALCFGWIDGQAGTVDEHRSQQLLTPRKPKSNWSRLNKQRVEKLLATNSIAPAGLAAIDLAKRTGTWDALNDVENLLMPKDLAAAFAQSPQAFANWETFPRSAKRAILEWLLNAKREPTRLKRIEQIVSEAEAGRRANQ